MKYSAIITNTETGEQRESQHDSYGMDLVGVIQHWMIGDAECDCNRESTWRSADGGDSTCGSTRFAASLYTEDGREFYYENPSARTRGEANPS